MSELPRMDRSIVKKSTLEEQGNDDLITDKSPGELMAMVWPITCDAWAFWDPTAAERRLQRHVVRVVRRAS